MQIVVVGAGTLGRAIVNSLSNEGHSILVIEKNQELLSDMVNTYDVNGVWGDAASFSTLEEAGVPTSDVFVAVTPNDELNVLSCILAKKSGTKRTIARVRNMDYVPQFSTMHELGLNLALTPEQEAAKEIGRILRFPSALKRETFAKGLIDLIEFRIENGNKLTGLSLKDVYSTFKTKILVCAVERNDEVFIPSGNFVLQQGDKLNITGSPKSIAAFFKKLGIYKSKADDVIVLGGSQLTEVLLDVLTDAGHNVKVIEENVQQTKSLAADYPEVTVINAPVTDQDVLLEEGLNHADAVVAMTGVDEQNIIVSIFAKTCKVPTVLTEIKHDKFNNIVESVGIDSVISPVQISTNKVTRYIRAMRAVEEDGGVHTLYKLVDDRVEALEFAVGSNSKLLKVQLKDLELKDNVLIAGIIRNNNLIVPSGDDSIFEEDRIIVVTTHKNFTNISDILR